MSDKIVTVTPTRAPDPTEPDIASLDKMLADLDAQDEMNTNSLQHAQFANRSDLVADARELIMRNAHLRELIISLKEKLFK